VNEEVGADGGRGGGVPTARMISGIETGPAPACIGERGGGSACTILSIKLVLLMEEGGG
jgi:hypothetical protein